MKANTILPLKHDFGKIARQINISKLLRGTAFTPRSKYFE